MRGRIADGRNVLQLRFRSGRNLPQQTSGPRRPSRPDGPWVPGTPGFPGGPLAPSKPSLPATPCENTTMDRCLS